MKERKQVERKFGKTVEWSLGSVLKNKPQTLLLLMILQTQTLLTNLHVLSEELPSALRMPKHTLPFLTASDVQGSPDCREVTTECVVSKPCPLQQLLHPFLVNAWAELQ